MMPKDVRGDAWRAQRIRTVLGEMVEDVVRIKIEASRVLERVMKLEDAMRMMMEVAGKMGTPEVAGKMTPSENKTREGI